MVTLTLRPNAAGDLAQLGSNSALTNWQSVNEVIADDATTYVLATATGQQDLYNLPNHTTESGVINFIKVYWRFRRQGGGADDGCPIIKTHSTIYQGEVHGGFGNWETYSDQWNTNPNTGVAWTWADIDALQIGFKCTTFDYDIFFTQIYVEVDYTPPVITTTLYTIGTGTIRIQ